MAETDFDVMVRAGIPPSAAEEIARVVAEQGPRPISLDQIELFAGLGEYPGLWWYHSADVPDLYKRLLHATQTV